MKNIMFNNKLSLGDVVVCTAAIRDLHKAHPGKFKTGYIGTASALFEHNPYIHDFGGDLGGVETIRLEYPAIHTSNSRPIHFIEAYHEFLSDRLGVKIPVTDFKGDIHLSGEERQWTNQVESIVKYDIPFWIILSGGKFDFTCKWWGADNYQKVVDTLKEEVLFVQVGCDAHNHPPLKGVIDLRDKTNVRQLVRLVHHSSGVLCPVTGMMHMAAAVPCRSGNFPTRPCVVVAGGREPVSWEHYPSHQFLHTQGMLPCCHSGGCWRSRVEPLNDGSKQDNSLCKIPEATSFGVIPKCMDMIKPDDVVNAIRKYIYGGAAPSMNQAMLREAQKYVA